MLMGYFAGDYKHNDNLEHFYEYEEDSIRDSPLVGD